MRILEVVESPISTIESIFWCFEACGYGGLLAD